MSKAVRAHSQTSGQTLVKICRLRLESLLHFAANECPLGYREAVSVSRGRFILMEKLPSETAKKIVRKMRNLRYATGKA